MGIVIIVLIHSILEIMNRTFPEADLPEFPHLRGSRRDLAQQRGQSPLGHTRPSQLCVLHVRGESSWQRRTVYALLI